jgi:DNA replication and repair protein RecF
VPLRAFRAENFRCLEKIGFDADPRYNLVYGANASGKTSILEAVAYLGRGKSFRGAPPASLIRHGSSEFTLFGIVDRGSRDSRIGVRNSREGLEVRVDGDASGGAASLAEALPLQVIDPEVHALVSGGPDHRRRFVDWMAFHVEHDFLAAWRRFRRALQQRNAAIKTGKGLQAWTAEFIELGERVDQLRRAVIRRSEESLAAHSRQLLGTAVRFEYRGGWPADKSLGEAVAESRERDLQQGNSQVGPHRADLALQVDERQARRLVSRGQQKLLACAMVLAATDIAQHALERPLLLLMDDPAAELDPASLERLMNGVFALGSQVIATSLDRAALTFPAQPTVFHVEQGQLSTHSNARL